MDRYDHKLIEKKWQERWERDEAYRTPETVGERKFYVLDMFPYPSGNGLHVGHPEGYTATDIIARKRRMEGQDVLHPMGWDAFGLPAENFAIKTGVHPKESTAKNIANFRRQLQMLGFSYDWSREVNTSDPSYYRWTQWLFLFLYKHDLAYKRKAPVNWCPSCQTVLANEQAEGGVCERCGHEVVQKDLEQWFFRVTDYAERLLSDLSKLDWPERILLMQKNWIGKSEGVEIAFRGELTYDVGEVHDKNGKVILKDKEFEVQVFTTRPDTLFGVSYVVLAPEHPLVAAIVAPERRAEVEAYVKAAAGKSELERIGTDKDKTGVPLGVSARHPFTGKEVPLWVADYALAGYGTGAVMGVPAHDDRDHAFAKKYDLPITHVVMPPAGVEAPDDAAYTDPGLLAGSGEFNGLTSQDAKQKIADALESKERGRRQTNWHLRDWLVSRQRYWGPPIPIIYCDECGEVPVPEEDLPVLLPDDVDFRPTGESPLARSASFHDVKCPHCGKPARRESDTLDTFVDSSWYFLRYPSPHDGDHAFSQHEVARWCPVDLYVGGAEHAVLHLLYSRFVTKALFDGGLLGFDEPFLKLKNPGLVLGENGEKMSKSRGNVVNPDDVVAEHGADTLRLYEMFMGEFDDAKPWDTKGIVGVRRFLDRAWTVAHDTVHQHRDEVPDDLDRLLHKTIKKVSADIEAFKFNTAISALMILSNEWIKSGKGSKAFAGEFVKLLSPFAPHLAEELWELLGHKTGISAEAWPTYDEAKTVDATVALVVQVNGKVRDRFEVPAGTDEKEVERMALESERIKAHLEGKAVRRVIVIRDRLVNIVI